MIIYGNPQYGCFVKPGDWNNNFVNYTSHRINVHYKLGCSNLDIKTKKNFNQLKKLTSNPDINEKKASSYFYKIWKKNNDLHTERLRSYVISQDKKLNL